MDDTARILELLLLAVLLPLWLLAGFADAVCHRVQRIEATAGVRETLLHWLMLAELGIGIVAALLLEINTGALALMLIACLAHELTTWVDLAYAEARRRIPPYEQWVHGLQQALPWVAWASISLAHRQQALAPFGLASAPEWTLRWKDAPLPAWTIMAVVAAAFALVVVPLAGELWRCMAARRR